MKQTKRTVTFFLAAIMCLLLTGIFPGCQQEAGSSSEAAPESYGIRSLKDLDGKTIGIPEGAAYLTSLAERYPNATLSEYDVETDLIQGLKTLRTDAYVIDEPNALAHLRETAGLRILDGYAVENTFAFLLRQEDTVLCQQVNGVITEFREDGTLAALEEKWLNGVEPTDFSFLRDLDARNGTLRVCLCDKTVPYAYRVGSDLVGYDVELIYRIAEKLGYGIEITAYDFSALIPAVESGREDIAIGGISYTDERSENVQFSVDTYRGGAVAVVLDSSYAGTGWLERLVFSFERAFIREDRWRLVTDGLLVTVELSLLTLVTGTLAGFGFSFLLRSKSKIVSRTAGAVSTIMDGLPLLVILMVAYYILFANTTLSAVFIGTMGLSMDFANCVAGILNTGIQAVDGGQIEAATAMGYPAWKIFFRITLPQAADRMFSQYIGAAVSMVKGTSIIGYITVQDLTKAGDLIRSRTYDAFLPLFATSAIYFLLTQVLAIALHAAAEKLNPRNRRRRVRGVQPV